MKATYPQKIIAAARECIGTPEHHVGRTLGVGLDCAGLIAHVCNRLSIPFEDLGAYGRYQDHLDLYRSKILTVARPVRAAAPGDIVLFRYRGVPNHAGILTEAGTFVHAWAAVGCVIESPLDGTWLHRIHSAYRFKGL